MFISKDTICTVDNTLTGEHTVFTEPELALINSVSGWFVVVGFKAYLLTENNMIHLDYLEVNYIETEYKDF